ncbi:MAG: DMT family transporter [Alphaproteobacteria bacterium]|nr:DMT family transporter [Alphaproteobacteria bacterium]
MHWKDGLLLLLAATIYGGIFPVNRLAAEAAWPPVGFAFLQSILAGVILLVVLFLRGDRLPLAGYSLMTYLIIGGLVVGLPIGILVSAAEHLDASVITLVLCLSPILTLVIGSIAGLERFDRTILLGMLLGTAGIAVIAIPDTGVIAADAVGWFLLALVAPVMFASANNCAKWLRPQGATSVAMAAGTLLGAGAVSLVVVLARGAAFLPAFLDFASLLPLAVATSINAAFFWLFFLIVERVGPARFSLFNYLAVAAGILWSLVVFGEQPASLFWIALLLMVAGMYVALSRTSRG